MGNMGVIHRTSVYGESQNSGLLRYTLAKTAAQLPSVTKNIRFFVIASKLVAVAKSLCGNPGWY